jgi:undecaprenyl diphosphate synthase
MKNVSEIVKDNNIKHVAVIMDGNRRWAKEHNLPTTMGHKKGTESLRTIMKACTKWGIEYLTVYAFSTENWKRTSEEVNFLMDLLVSTLKTELDEMHKNGVRIKFIGDISKLSDKLKKVISDSEETTKSNTKLNLQIAFNYGARDEITNAVKEIAKKYHTGEITEINEQTVSDYLYTKSIPDPDILIRTGGEMRISNYLLWQIAYSEIIVVEEFWPDFGEESFEKCLNEFDRRNRRFGK